LDEDMAAGMYNIFEDGKRIQGEVIIFNPNPSTQATRQGERE
jgi:hypothetical protein